MDVWIGAALSAAQWAGVAALVLVAYRIGWGLAHEPRERHVRLGAFGRGPLVPWVLLGFLVVGAYAAYGYAAHLGADAGCLEWVEVPGLSSYYDEPRTEWICVRQDEAAFRRAMRYYTPTRRAEVGARAVVVLVPLLLGWRAGARKPEGGEGKAGGR